MSNRNELKEPMVTEKDIESAYNMLRNCLHRYQEADWNRAEYKAYVEKRTHQLFLAGKADGRNARIREAQVENILEEEHEMLYRLERKAEAAKQDLDLARIDVEKLRLLMRLYELRSGVDHVTH